MSKYYIANWGKNGVMYQASDTKEVVGARTLKNDQVKVRYLGEYGHQISTQEVEFDRLPDSVKEIFKSRSDLLKLKDLPPGQYGHRINRKGQEEWATREGRTAYFTSSGAIAIGRAKLDSKLWRAMTSFPARIVDALLDSGTKNSSDSQEPKDAGAKDVSSKDAGAKVTKSKVAGAKYAGPKDAGPKDAGPGSKEPDPWAGVAFDTAADGPTKGVWILKDGHGRVLKVLDVPIVSQGMNSTLNIHFKPEGEKDEELLSGTPVAKRRLESVENLPECLTEISKTVGTALTLLDKIEGTDAEKKDLIKRYAYLLSAGSWKIRESE